MSNEPERRRYVVSDLGFSWAVHDTGEGQEYAFETGKDKAHISTNELNSTRVGLYPNRAEAVRAAMELNAADAKKAG
jgi:hypothetical protein